MEAGAGGGLQALGAGLHGCGLLVDFKSALLGLCGRCWLAVGLQDGHGWSPLVRHRGNVVTQTVPEVTIGVWPFGG
jgi:hypothetical protein